MLTLVKFLVFMCYDLRIGANDNYNTAGENQMGNASRHNDLRRYFYLDAK